MITTQSPTRVDLAGGTLDCWPLFNFVPHAVTTNLAININSKVQLDLRNDQKCELSIEDLGFKNIYKNMDELLADHKRSEVALVRETLRAIPLKKGFRLVTSSQSPIGAGLGGSSSMAISLLRAFSLANGQELKASDAKNIVELAHNIEARVLATPTGTQDYVPAYLGGLNALHYSSSGLHIEELNLDLEELTKNMTLIYTGRPHHSGLNNWSVIKAAIDKDQHTLDCLNQISSLSILIYQAIKTGRFYDLPKLFNEESTARISLSPGFTSPEIEALRGSLLEIGAEALKICGAGGGGCVLVWADPKLRGKISKLCEKNGFKNLQLKAVERLEKKSQSSIEIS